MPAVKWLKMPKTTTAATVSIHTGEYSSMSRSVHSTAGIVDSHAICKNPSAAHSTAEINKRQQLARYAGGRKFFRSAAHFQGILASLPMWSSLALRRAAACALAASAAGVAIVHHRTRPILAEEYGDFSDAPWLRLPALLASRRSSELPATVLTSSLLPPRSLAHHQFEARFMIDSFL